MNTKSPKLPVLFNKHKQRKRIPKDAVHITRGTGYGNPYILGEHGNREEVCNKFEEYAEERYLKDPKFRKMVKALRGKDLVCVCAPQRCHGDWYLRKANEEEYVTEFECHFPDFGDVKLEAKSKHLILNVNGYIILAIQAKE